jgi:signal transduction histidine kinase
VRSFTFRITCRFAALVLATTAAVLVIGGFLLDRQNRKGIEMLHDVEFAELSALLGPPREFTATEVSARIRQDADSDAALFVMQIANARGEILFRSDNLGETLLPAATSSEPHWTATLPNFGDVLISAYSSGPLRFSIGTLLHPSQRMMNDYMRMCIPLLLGVALVSIALGYAFSRATLRPLRAIEATANRIKADNLAERIPMPSGRDELGALTQLLNQMFDRLQRSFDQINRFAADASHEMKTPLALIRLHVERLAGRLQHDPEGAAAISDIMEEIAGLHRVIDRLLFLAKTESGAISPAMRPVEMLSFIATFAEDAAVLAEDKRVRFVVGRNDGGIFPADAEMIRQLLLNLVANAVAVSTPGQTVRLDSHERDGAWHLVVTDEGPGIPPSEMGRLFTRFFHVSAGERRTGNGLGLTLCRSIAELHQGSIEVENRGERSGLRVTATLRK